MSRSQRRELAARAANKKTAEKKSENAKMGIVIFFGLITVGLIIGLPLRYFYKQSKDYQAKVVKKARYERNSATKKIAPAMNIDELFSDELKAQYEDGGSLEVEFVTKVGYREFAQKVNIDPWTSWEETDVPVRVEYVKEREKYIRQFAKSFAEGIPTERTVVIAVDDTSGITVKMRTAIDENIKNLALDAWLTDGNGLNIRFYRLSNSAAPESKQLSFAMKGKLSETQQAEAKNKLKEAFDWVTSDRGPQPKSSIATALFAIGSEFSEPIELIVASDGMENSDLISFYKDKQLLLEGRHDEIDQKITGLRPFPKMEGSAVTWLLVIQSADQKLTKATQDYWERVYKQQCRSGQFTAKLIQK